MQVDELTAQERNYLDKIFEALTIVSEGDYVFVYDFTHKIVRFSRNFTAFCGMDSEYVSDPAALVSKFVHRDDVSLFTSYIQRIEKGNVSDSRLIVRFLWNRERYVPCTVKAAVLSHDGDPALNGNAPEYVVGSINNHGIQPLMDPVTELKNQYALFEDLSLLLKEKKPRTVMMLGLANFSHYNNDGGYSFGNKVLTVMGRALVEWAGNDNSRVYRLDGPRFAIISKLSDERVLEEFQLLRKQLKDQLSVESHILQVSLSCGILEIEDFKITVPTIYACLNFAYSRSKYDQQGNGYIFRDRMGDGARLSMQKLSAIRSCVADHCKGFMLYYQPVVSARTEKISGAEALIRWGSAEFGLVPPVEFIPVLEEDSIFPELGRWIFKKALTDVLPIVKVCPDFVINVNASYAQFLAGDFVSSLHEILKETGFPPQNLCIEVTERCRLLDLSLLKSIMVQLKTLGVRFALDDFGTGFSSLNILKALPFDTIKIDRDTVRNVVDDKKDMAAVHCITDLASVFGTDVCIEGIEKRRMKELLQADQVTSFQGYYYSKPVPLPEFQEIWQRQ